MRTVCVTVSLVVTLFFSVLRSLSVDVTFAECLFELVDPYRSCSGKVEEGARGLELAAEALRSLVDAFLSCV